MTVLWHRELTGEDVATAHRILPLHQPADPGASRPRCASASHQHTIPEWPCARARWAWAVLAADERGEVESRQTERAET